MKKTTIKPNLKASITFLAAACICMMAACEKNDENKTDLNNNTVNTLTDNPRNNDTVNTPTDNLITVSVTDGEWIDLGLPSGRLWMSHNLGAMSPEEAGDRIAWGEIESKKEYTWDTYIHGDQVLKNINGEWTVGYDLYKYNNSLLYGAIDDLLYLEREDDAAAMRCEGSAHTPSESEWQELYCNCTLEWARLHGTQGCYVTGRNGNSIFLPANEKIGDSLVIYWLNKINRSYAPSADRIGIQHGDNDEGHVCLAACVSRERGLRIRPVSGGN